MKILIVEDDADTRALIKMLVLKRSHEVMDFEDAESAWDTFQTEHFDIAIIDWILPQMTGLELTRKIRSRAGTIENMDIPTYIIVATAKDSHDDLSAALDSGADDYITKPFNLKILNVRLAVAEKQIIHAIRQNKADEQLRLSSIVFNLSDEGIMITDHDNNIILVNEAFSKITQYSAEEAMGKNPRFLQSNLQDKAFFKKMWHAIHDQDFWQGELWNRRKEGEVYSEWLTVRVLRNKKGKITNYVGVFSDKSQGVRAKQELQYAQNHDRLTKLPNRFQFVETVRYAISMSKKTKKEVAILFIDINRFKLINETFGQGMGDYFLQMVATRLKKLVTSEDNLARVGGDEFTLLVEDIQNLQDVTQIAQKIIDDFQTPFLIQNSEIMVTICIGIALYPDDGKDALVLLRNADSAVYKAKEIGINNYQFYTPEINTRAFEQLTLEIQLRKSIKENQLLIYYQPQWEIGSKKILGMEALLRWKHPELGMVSPEKFIPLAEENGLIIPISEWIIESVIRQILEWKSQDYRKYRVAINISARQFHESDIVGFLEKMLTQYAIDSSNLELELTERITMWEGSQNIEKMMKIREMGIHLSLDDFGTGYSSLSYLRKFPIDLLKIDQSFIKHLNEKMEDAAIVKTIIAMGKSLRMKTIAEGVETEEQRKFLQENGCDYGQGFLISPALPASEIVSFLEKTEK